MGKKVVIINGSYRKGAVVDQLLNAVQEELRGADCSVEMFTLRDLDVGFCNNCRACLQADPSLPRGQCFMHDDMDPILDAIQEASGLVLASPMNCGNVTAIMQRFLERLAVFGYWPWGKPAPLTRTGAPKGKQALVFVTSAMPGIMAQVVARSPVNRLEQSAKTMGAAKTRHLFLGPVPTAQHPTVSAGTIRRVRAAAGRLARAL